MELLRIITLNHRADAAVHHITCSKYKVRILGVDHVHPSGQLGPAVMIAQMQVTYQYYLERLLQWLIGMDGQFLTILVVIVQPANEHDQRHASYYRAEPFRTALEEIGREQAAYLCKTGKQERQQQIQKEYKPGVAHIIYYLCQPQRQPLNADETDKEQRHPGQERQQHSGLNSPDTRSNTPQPPAYVDGKSQQQPYKQQCNCFIHRL